MIIIVWHRLDFDPRQILNKEISPVEAIPSCSFQVPKFNWISVLPKVPRPSTPFLLTTPFLLLPIPYSQSIPIRLYTHNLASASTLLVNSSLYSPACLLVYLPRASEFPGGRRFCPPCLVKKSAREAFPATLIVLSWVRDQESRLVDLFG